MAIFLDWNGEGLSPDVLAIVLFTVLGASPEAPIPILAAAATDDDQALIRPDRLGRFLVQHAEHKLVCADAAQLHWAIAATLNPIQQSQELECLWKFSRECRLIDVVLYGALVCHYKGEPMPQGGLAGVAKLCRRQFVDPAQLAKDYLASARATVAGSAKPELHARMLAQATLLGDIYRELNVRATTLFAPGFERLTGLQVQGAIALGSASRIEFRFDRTVAAELILHLEEQRSNHARALAADTNAQKAFLIKDGQVVLRRELPEIRDVAALAGLLDSILSKLVGPNETPWPRVELADGRISLRPEDYGALRDCDSVLHAWSKCVSIGRALQLLRAKYQQTLIVKYDVLPRIQTQPSQETIQLLVGRELLWEASGGTFVIATFADLELRALASICESRLSEALRGGLQISDFLKDLGRQLQQSGVELRPATAADQADLWPKVAKELLRAAGLMLGTNNSRRILNRKFNSGIRAADCERLYESLFAAFPGLKMRVDRAVASLRRSFPSSQADQEHCGPVPKQDRNWELSEFGEPTVLDRADAAVKAAMYGVVAAGYRLAACSAAGFAVTLSSRRSADEALSAIQEIASAAATTALRGIPAPCACAVRQTW